MEYKNMVGMKAKNLNRKALLLLAMLLAGGVASAQVIVKGSVYGGGQGIRTDEAAGLVTGNATVTMNGGTVERSIYGGGELGSVGTFIEYTPFEYDGNLTVDVPKRCAQGTGLATVTVNGGHVGKNGSLMGVNPDDDDRGWIFCGGRGEADSINYPKAIALGVVGSTHLTFGTIENATQPLVTASVYGGCENGLVLEDTHVEIRGGQIGTGLVSKTQGENNVWTGTWHPVYDDTKWTAAINAVRSGNATAINAAAGQFHECDTWPYGDGNGHYYVYDINAGASGYNSYGGALQGSNGQTFFGNVFGGGSGYYPIAPGVWRRTAGQVNGNTLVEVTGGHILTSIYGGNEMTDVKGTCTVNMTGGTLGVPRTLAQIEAHPVTCYLFGAGKGDQRVLFNKWTNVQNAVVNIGGNAFFFGSVFGGGEDGHVLGNVTVNINTETGDDAYIGTWGYSYVDGNVFGGGRGFSGDALTAGSVGGNVTLNIGGGTMLGSIYGGGRLASVGTYFVGPNDDNYGQMQPDEGNKTHGHIAINITGGTIGNDYESKLHLGNPDLADGRSYGGNVFGGSMGRLTLLDGNTNLLWPNLGKVKNTHVSISGNNTIIKGNVYGGSELGTLAGDATVTIEGGTIWCNVFGGSYGSDNTTMTAPLDVNEGSAEVNPMQRAGRIDGNTSVNIAGGWVKKCVYGGGELASVGTITELPTEHAESGQNAHPFNISWPYEFKYAENTGTARVNITGGRIGLTGKDYMGPWNDDGVPYDPVTGDELTEDQIEATRKDNGDVYGAGKGKAGDRYEMADCANVNNTVVFVEYPSGNNAKPGNYKDMDDNGVYINDCISGALYGGGENGHVNTDASVTLKNGLVGHNLYGGGKGDDTYKTMLYVLDENQNPVLDEHGEHVLHEVEITSITAGKVYGNTNVTMNGGYVVRNVFGGGNHASVGKGNYASGPNDFTPQGYGEQWTAANNAEMQALFDNSGHTYLNINGGVIGTVNGMNDGIPTGNVYGSSRGEPAPNVRQNINLTPRINYYPEFFLGYANHTHVVIGKEENGDGPRLYGSVFGGGENGHVRWDATVTVNKGIIGNRYDDATIEQVGTGDVTNYQWRGRGCVFGGGAGLGKFTDATGSHYSTSAGSVTQFTTVNINGGTIYQSVYGGGPMSSVGPPAMGQETVPSTAYSLAKVNIRSTIGDPEVVKESKYGGNVYGAARGVVDPTDPLLNFDRFSTTMFTEVNLYEGANVPGNVYGGGQLGQVKNDTKVNMIGGTVGTIEARKASGSDVYTYYVHSSGGRLFGGGAGYPRDFNAARVKGNTEVNISGGHVLYNVYGGGELASVGQHTEALADPNNPNSEVIDFIPVANTGLAKVTVTGGQVGPAPKVESGYAIPVGLDGTDGYVFGGGQGIGDDSVGNNPSDENYPGRYHKFADVNNTHVTVNITKTDTVNNRIWGSVFGGSEDGHVLGDNFVEYKSGFLGTNGKTSYDGNIFGGGRNFSKKNYTAGRTRGNNTVEMTGGQIFGNIYGGGRLALTGTGLRGLTVDSEGNYSPMLDGDDFGNTKVMVKGGIVGNNKKTNANPLNPNELVIETFSEYSMGNVYGGGMGHEDGITVEGHPKASALMLGMTKNTEVEISGTIEGTRVYGIVFGGGEKANVGQYSWKVDSETGTVHNIDVVEGLAKVAISGGTIGADRAKMRYEAGDAPYQMYPKYNDDLGYVYGGGEGVSDDPNNSALYPQIHSEGLSDPTISLLDLMATVNTTEVEISGGWVKASVFGGAESGHVRGNTKVTISGGQIGAGDNGTTDLLYTDNQFVNPLDGITTSLYPTAHWDYGITSGGETVYNPYDPVNVMNGAIPSDGKSWFGNVFGGGSGWFPYIVNEGTEEAPVWKSKWNSNSGKVWGNTEVIITGGHILNNVYGANESTDVGDYGIADAAYHTEHPNVPVGAPYCKSGGKATVRMSGGTVGVPRIKSDIEERPILGSVFGGGCGDPRTIFDALTNVDSTYVEITGGFVYASVFGGAEEGHVLDSTNVRICQAEGKTVVIGCSGLSGADGNVFGGGKGKDKYLQNDYNFACGRVQGNTHVKLSSGNVLGNIFGGGKVALTGVDVNGSYTSYINTSSVYDSIHHGRTLVEVCGGSVGNNANYGLALLTCDNDLGNVYGGGRGNPEDFIEDDMGRVANAIIRISGNPNIYGSVFGGGQMANVGHWIKVNDDELFTSKTGTAHVTISGSPTIGTAKEFDHEYSIGTGDLMPQWTWYDTINNVRMISHTCTGNVFGGGQGDVEIDFDEGEVVGLEQGHCRTTLVEISGNPTIRSSVFGGSEDGMVWGDTKVKIAGGTIGTMDILSDSLVQSGNTWTVKPLHATYSYGNVFGGSYGKDAIIHLNDDEHEITQAQMDEVNTKAGRIYGNTYVEITDGAVRGNVFGGSNYGSVVGNAEVKISKTGSGDGPEIGPLDYTGLNAYVYGGGKGFHDDPTEDNTGLRKAYANVANTKVTVEGGTIDGSVFGGGSDAHVLGNAEVTVTGGLLGTTGTTTWDGNIFGGGRNYLATNLTNGRVGGNITVNMKGGTMLGSIFGGGRLGSVGIDEDGDMQEDNGDDTYGYVTVNVGDESNQNDIIIGHSATNHDDRVGGNVYGGGKGIAGAPTSIYPKLAKVKQTYVNIKEQTGKQTWIEGSVFGSGEDGHVLQDTYVKIYGGQIGGEEYGDLDPCDDPYHGNVYGGGRGVDTYEQGGQQHYSTTAGKVNGNTNVNIYGGHVIRNVYGGGNVASVGIYEDDGQGHVTESGGMATVTITGGTIGTTGENENYGNVFGSGHGGVGGDFIHLAYVKNTHVTIGETAQVYGSVFGGGEDGHVRKNTLVDVKGGTIGVQNDAYQLNGNVYGGGRGITTDQSGQISATAGEVFGHTTVNIFEEDNTKPTTIWRNVYGGGSASMVNEYKVVNIYGGTVKQSVFGGSREIPAGRQNFAPRWVNMWGGTVEGHLHGCSFNSDDGDPEHSNPESYWASFVNMKGGTVLGNVYGAGESGNVYGSVAVLIGENAINKALTDVNTYRPGTDINKDKLDIRGSVFGGSVGIPNQSEGWNQFDITGTSNVYIDGTGYNTTDGSTADLYMNIGGGIYGCGTYCESGALGRNILLRNYGTRNPEGDPTAELTTASRTLTTIQRANMTLLDNANVNLTGADDISGHDSNRKFGVLQMDAGFYSTNGSGIVLGATGASAYMDSIREVRSLWLSQAVDNVYTEISNPHGTNWEMVGINGNDDNNKLYRIHSDNSSTALTPAQENVIVFNGDSRLWVRYFDRTAATRRKYGELYGFFRMSSPFSPRGTESFAYARPKLTAKVNPIAGYNTGTYEAPSGNTWNASDGGFLSYNDANNFFTRIGQTVLNGVYTYRTEGDDGGLQYTNTKQYPYFNIGEFVTRDNDDMDLEEYREWVLPTIAGKIWYVDGRGLGNGGWGKDGNNTDRWGHYPDMPKKTISGSNGVYKDQTSNEELGFYPFKPADDIVYVVGPIEAINENENLNQETDYTLKLYRYPGGHMMSNGQTDVTVSGIPATNPMIPTSDTYSGFVNIDFNEVYPDNPEYATYGPGANKDMMIHANKKGFVMNNVLVDGLFEYTDDEITMHNIPNSYKTTEKLNVSEPLVVTESDAILTLNGGTVLQRGYNNTNGQVWYTNSDYLPSGTDHHSGGLFVNDKATVNVSGLVTITGNKQNLNGTPIVSNVYLPTFAKYLNITANLDAATRIGITSPKRNNDPNYLQNTFSPLAKAADPAFALAAWQNNNFRDDLGWFFVNKHSSTHQRTTYYEGTVTKSMSNDELYFGWTWANVVRKAPAAGDLSGEVTDDFSYSNINSPYDLAWLISLTSGMNGQTATNLNGTAIAQTADIDLLQYVWVPVGSAMPGTKPFAGSFDGRGHLVTNLTIDFIGDGDLRYERENYGLFGYVNGNGVVNRTFVVSGRVQPRKTDIEQTSYVPNLGGLVGQLDGNAKIMNSEAAIQIVCPNFTNDYKMVAGGLVGLMKGGIIHSSMAMPDMTVGNLSEGMVGGLVGKATAGQVNNSFANTMFSFPLSNRTAKAGGLMGENSNATMSNCYANLRGGYGGLTATNFGGLAATNLASSNINNCYVMQNPAGLSYNLVIAGDNACQTSCGKFAPVISSDALGYMYADNKVTDGLPARDTTMFVKLNDWVKTNHPYDGYAYWARPGLQNINGDLPVLLLSDLSSSDVKSTDDFRSVATYEKGKALQYGGTVRDGSDKHLSEMLKRDEYVFVYGDVDGHDESGFDGDDALATVTIEADKVSLYEHASIKYPGQLAALQETYVGITFDNSYGKAYSTPGVNYGLVGMGGFLLPRDWHMFSTPLSNAPLGFDYVVDGTNTNTSSYSGGDHGNYFNNPWVNSSGEFSWLNGIGRGRYWMKAYATADGYFPTQVDGTAVVENDKLFIVGSDECPTPGVHRYPYGMDFYTWYEPQYHWVNFKRNGPNHWHSDENDNQYHEHLDYYGDPNHQGEQDYLNQNEDNLIVGKGYMASITIPTFMQSHGTLNNGDKRIALTHDGAHLTGWNLVGNPYHGYLDFTVFAKNTDNARVLTTNADNQPFYVVYDADQYEEGHQGSGFLYYPMDGSRGGEYAGRFIHPHQGFYVKVADNAMTNESNVLQFNESMVKSRSVVTESHFRDEEPAYPLVNLYLSSDKGCADVTVIEFGRPEWGGAKKLKELRVGDGLFYAQHNDTHYAALFTVEGIERVPLWFEAKDDDIFTIKWNTANADFQSMYLVDNMTGVRYDMLRNNSYSFEGHKGDYPSRFYITFRFTDVEENQDHPFVFFDGSQWVVTGEGEVEFIDLLGQVLARRRVSGQTRLNLPEVAEGVYLFRLIEGQETKIQKVIVKK